MTDITRRQFVTTAVASVITPWRGIALAGTPIVRRDIGGLTLDDPIIVSYRKAIRAMRALDAKDPRSWAYQAAIHGTTISPQKTAWNSCEHATYFFWSWHRMYLYWFERIVQKMANDPSWGVPYWNWTSPKQRRLPAIFRDTSSELYASERDASMNNGRGELPSTAVSYAAGFSQVRFANASTSVEQMPHNPVHGLVGGDTGWMGDTKMAAQDPIFYVHHSNVDRLWNLWLAQAGRSDPLNDGNWKSKKFVFFDENGQLVNMTGCDVLGAAKQLNYTYEGEPVQVDQTCQALASVVNSSEVTRSERYVMLWSPITLGSEPVIANFDIQTQLNRITAAAVSKTESLLLELDGVEADQQPGVIWEVYLGASEEEIKRGIDSPYFVGTVSLFGAGIRADTHHNMAPARFIFPIKRVVQTALKANETNLPLTFVPTGPLIDGKPSRPDVKFKVTIAKLSVLIEPLEERRQQ